MIDRKIILLQRVFIFSFDFDHPLYLCSEFNRAIKRQRQGIKRKLKNGSAVGLEDGANIFDAEKEILSKANERVDVKGTADNKKMDKVWRRLVMYVEQRNDFDGAKLSDIVSYNDTLIFALKMRQPIFPLP